MATTRVRSSAALPTLLRVEAKLLMRDPGALFTLAVPLFILLVFSSDVPPGDTTLFAMVLALSLGLVGLYMVPTSLAGYRESGVLRRMSATPVHPAILLGVQLGLHLVYAVLSSAFLLCVAVAVFGAAPPASAVSLVLVLLLGSSSLFCVGLVIAALASDARMANGVGVLLYFPMAYLAGVMAPEHAMPEAAVRIGAFTPLGAMRGALQDAWAGTPVPILPLAIMAGYTVVLGAIAARTFRWG